MEQPPKNIKPVVLASLLAAILLIASGLAYRALASYLSRSTSEPAVARGTLARLFPIRLDDWTGQNVPLDEKLVRAAQADDYLNRVYTRRAGTETVGLYISYGLRARDLMPHRPEVCYPAAGWTLKENRRVDLALSDGTRLDGHVFHFARAGLTVEDITVLGYYLADDRIAADISTLRSNAWRGTAGIHRVAQIQITAFGDSLHHFDEAAASVCRFAALSGPAIRRLFLDPSLRSPAPARP